ncbi:MULTISPECIES: hypothetical protein [unclassified Rhizobium]|jgi:hypothetical protein|uniref:hypothetical protein n=1 Tax=unclassified Rhizobium TaxID=2613769 RepID=UPI000646B802|nr:MULTISPECIES: hypothetical protein [unclassified Rhizobium]MBN8950190.1 hypothetical protein [Rhizobium tropici]OJY62459.1 MAG: hypothetical protein BGP09_15225 [Rhizobium sp. 60-20]RKD74512.1 hypothetical protein BJ928_101865 [Rhizobium sp. WW_1]
MRNFGSIRIACTKAEARATCLGVARGGFADAVPVRSDDLPSAVKDHLVYFAGLALAGYSDTSAKLPR